MSRKQEIYRQFLARALPASRNCLSQFRKAKPFNFLSLKRQRSLRNQYEIAQLVHNLYVTILEEDFLDHDIWFLNVQARSFYERNDESCAHYPVFCYYIQELFKEVPADRRDALKWDGPQGDFSWTLPKCGDGLSPSSTR